MKPGTRVRIVSTGAYLPHESGYRLGDIGTVAFTLDDGSVLVDFATSSRGSPESCAYWPQELEVVS